MRIPNWDGIAVRAKTIKSNARTKADRVEEATARARMIANSRNAHLAPSSDDIEGDE